MVRAHDPALRLQTLTEERFGLIEPTELLDDTGEAYECGQGIGVFGPEDFTPQLQALAENPFRFPVFFLFPQYERQGCGSL